MNYEAYIGGYWYPVKILGESDLIPGLHIVNVEVTKCRAWDGIERQPMPFTDYSSTGGGSDNKYGYVNPGSIRPTDSDPLETIYPKETDDE